ncbi:hypothetical protein TRFO_05681 [Tritrichomonas foetus]|uniref:Uncharacterized protein n=1 Tax=Tritrichomonas foetus TaxID=1144522 RepID=A0A1J4K595_9EUKA|nr:hypothetical protein TRFO_05681 [Tritrichomonas foetus]|eukprot:OHT06040.1 hypothetical protein TRFO_05681 [Tritrichomonas foetus]
MEESKHIINYLEKESLNSVNVYSAIRTIDNFNFEDNLHTILELGKKHQDILFRTISDHCFNFFDHDYVISKLLVHLYNHPDFHQRCEEILLNQSSPLVIRTKDLLGLHHQNKPIETEWESPAVEGIFKMTKEWISDHVHPDSITHAIIFDDILRLDQLYHKRSLNLSNEQPTYGTMGHGFPLLDYAALAGATRCFFYLIEHGEILQNTCWTAINALHGQSQEIFNYVRDNLKVNDSLNYYDWNYNKYIEFYQYPENVEFSDLYSIILDGFYDLAKFILLRNDHFQHTNKPQSLTELASMIKNQDLFDFLVNICKLPNIKHQLPNFDDLIGNELQLTEKITHEIQCNNFHHILEICQQEKITLKNIDWRSIFVNNENLDKFLDFIFENNIEEDVFDSTCDVKVLQGMISRGYTFERPLKAFGESLSYIIPRAQIGGLVDLNRNPAGIWFDEVEMGIESIVYYTKKYLKEGGSI